MKWTLLAGLLLALMCGACVDKKAEGTGLPAPQVGVATDTTAGKTKAQKELPVAEVAMPDVLKPGESPAGGTVSPPLADSAQQAPAPVSPPSYEPEKKTTKLELLDFDKDKADKGKGKKNDGKKKSPSSRTSPPAQRPAEYSAPTTVPARQSAALPVVQGSILTAGQLSSWQGLVREVNEKTAVPAEVAKILPRKKPTLACSDCATALLFAYKYLVFHNDETNATKWYNKSKRFDCADRSALLGVLIAANQEFATFVTK